MGADSMKAGGSAGHGLVLSCQGAECRPRARSRGRSRAAGEGDPPPRPRLPSPPLLWNARKTRDGEPADGQMLSPARRPAGFHQRDEGLTATCRSTCGPAVKTDVRLGSSNSRRSVGGRHRREVTDSSRELTGRSTGQRRLGTGRQTQQLLSSCVFTQRRSDEAESWSM